MARWLVARFPGGEMTGNPSMTSVSVKLMQSLHKVKICPPH